MEIPLIQTNQTDIFNWGFDRSLYRQTEKESNVSVYDTQTDLVDPNLLSGGYTSSDLFSANFKTGVSGWKLSYLGDLEANTGTFRGALTGNTITGATITGGTIRTAATGDRVVMTGSSLITYDVTDSLLVRLGGGKIAFSNGTYYGVDIASANTATEGRAELNLYSNLGAPLNVYCFRQNTFKSYESTTPTVDLGDTTHSWRNLYLGKIGYAGGNIYTDKGQVLKLQAGETIAANKAVYVSKISTNAALVTIPTEQTTDTSSQNIGDVTTYLKRIQSFKVPIECKMYSAEFSINKNGGGNANNWTFGVYADNAGIPGTELFTVTKTQLQVGNDIVINVSASNITLAKDTTYWLRWATTYTNQASYLIKDSNGSTYANGLERRYNEDTASWEDQDRDIHFHIFCYRVAGYIYNADATDAERANTFIGFNQAALVAGDTGDIQINGLMNGFTGLTAGIKYYLASNGDLGTTAGTKDITVGSAISTTQIVINISHNF